MTNKPTVTICVPAFNEVKTIGRLLSALESQQHTSFILQSITVYSDGSTDGTDQLIKSQFPSVRLVSFPTNKGKNIRMNQILKANRSDILIQADADITLSDNTVLDNLVQPLISDPEVGISCAYHIAHSSVSPIGRLAYFGFRIWDTARLSLGDQGIRYFCEGGLRAFSKQFTTRFRLPQRKHVGEDSYSFYYAVAHGYKVALNPKAQVYIDLAQNYHDYSRQMKRFLIEPQLMAESFPSHLTARYETMTFSVKLRSLLIEFLHHPLTGLLYLFLQLSVKIQTLFYRPPVHWVPITRK